LLTFLQLIDKANGLIVHFRFDILHAGELSGQIKVFRKKF